MVGTFLSVALVNDPEIRERIVPIFFDMIVCEFHTDDDTTSLSVKTANVSRVTAAS